MLQRSDCGGRIASVPQKNKSLSEHLSTRKGGLRLSGSLGYNHAASLIYSARNRPGKLPAPANDKAAASITNAADTFAR
jgi:hypothetical protein